MYIYSPGGTPTVPYTIGILTTSLPLDGEGKPARNALACEAGGGGGE